MDIKRFEEGGTHVVVSCSGEDSDALVVGSTYGVILRRRRRLSGCAER